MGNAVTKFFNPTSLAVVAAVAIVAGCGMAAALGFAVNTYLEREKELIEAKTDPVRIKGSLLVEQNLGVQKMLDVRGPANFLGGAEVEGDSTINGDLTLTGNSVITGDLEVQGDMGTNGVLQLGSTSGSAGVPLQHLTLSADGSFIMTSSLGPNGAELYVDNVNGDDSNDASMAAPVKHVAAALAVLTTIPHWTGDCTIFLMGTSYDVVVDEKWDLNILSSLATDRVVSVVPFNAPPSSVDITLTSVGDISGATYFPGSEVVACQAPSFPDTGWIENTSVAPGITAVTNAYASIGFACSSLLPGMDKISTPQTLQMLDTTFTLTIDAKLEIQTTHSISFRTQWINYTKAATTNAVKFNLTCTSAHPPPGHGICSFDHCRLHLTAPTRIMEMGCYAPVALTQCLLTADPGISTYNSFTAFSPSIMCIDTCAMRNVTVIIYGPINAYRILCYKPRFELSGSTSQMQLKIGYFTVPASSASPIFNALRGSKILINNLGYSGDPDNESSFVSLTNSVCEINRCYLVGIRRMYEIIEGSALTGRSILYELSKSTYFVFGSQDSVSTVNIALFAPNNPANRCIVNGNQFVWPSSGFGFVAPVPTNEMNFFAVELT